MGLVYWTPERLPGRAVTNRGRSLPPPTATGSVALRIREAGRRSRGVAVTFGLVATGVIAVAQMSCLSARAYSETQTSSSTDSATSSSAQPSTDSVVDLDVTNANMLAVVELLRRPGGTQFIISGDPKRFRPVTVHLTAPLSKMLEYVAASAGASVSKDEYGVYTICPRDAAALQPETTPRVSTGDEPAPRLRALAPTPTPTAPMHWETITLSYVQPAFVLSFLNVPDRPIASPYRNEHSDRLQTIQPPSGTITPGIVMMNGGSSETKNGGSVPYGSASSQSGVPLGGNSTDFSNAAGRATTTVGDTAQQFLAGGNPGGAVPGGAPAGQAGAAGAAAGPPLVQGIDNLIAIPEQNMILARGTSEGIAGLRDLISKLDLPAKEVSIKVEFVTASVDDVNSLGISYDLIPFSGITTGFSPPGSTYSTLTGTGQTGITYSYGNAAAQLLTLLTTTTGKEIAAPILTLTNGIQGTVTIIEEIPVTTTTTVAQGSGNALSGSTVSFEPIPTGLSATARINGDNSVTLQLVPIVSSVGAASSSGAVSTTSQTINTIMTVGNGETVVMGGLVQKTDNNTRYSIPILGDLPVIGSIFRSRNDTKSDSELLVFVTPTILPAPGATTTGEQAVSVDQNAVTVGVGVTP